MRLLAAIPIFSLLAASQAQPDDQKIVGGQALSVADAPYQGALIYKRSFICGCSILSSRYLLTAAHCVHDYKDNLAVRVGSSHAYRGGELVAVERVLRHPQFNSDNLNNDFALLRLKANISLEAGVKEAVRLPRFNENVDDGTPVFVSGFGLTKDADTNDHSLRGVVVPVVAHSTCKRAYPKLITAKMVCAGLKEGGKDSCSGDSGGPMVKQSDKTLIGVVSFGYDCALPNMYGVYAKVSSARTWIKANSGV